MWSVAIANVLKFEAVQDQILSAPAAITCRSIQGASVTLVLSSSRINAANHIALTEVSPFAAAAVAVPSNGSCAACMPSINHVLLQSTALRPCSAASLKQSNQEERKEKAHKRNTLLPHGATQYEHSAGES
jgi:hypothetical protein